MKVIISESECKILGLKVARIELNNSFDVKEIIDVFNNYQINLLRLKIINPNKDIYFRLTELNIPYYLMNISTIFYSDANRVLLAEDCENFRFVNYTQQHEEILKASAFDIFRGNGGAYFNNPHTAEIYNNEDELKALSEYISKQFTNDKNIWTKLIFDEDTIAGFVSYTIENNYALGNLFGVLPKYQSKGLGKKIGTFVLNNFIGTDVYNYVQIQHYPSLSLHYSLNMKPVGVAYTYQIFRK
jgi:hypothetical protein